MIRSGVLILLAIAASEATNVLLLNPHWVQFKKDHGKSYASVEEETARFFIFIQNLREIEAHNREFEAGKKSFSLGMNQFGDMTNEEFRAKMNGFKMPKNAQREKFFESSNVQIPESVDWRDKGYVTEVKDQKQCGSCWSFSATGALEGQHFKQTGKLISLSEQNLVDCSWDEGNEGCGGGWMDSAFTYIKKNPGVDTEVSYPYEAKDGKCRFNKANVGANDTGFVDIKSGSESDLENAIATVGPISVAIDASRLSFQFYQSGVYDESRCKNGIDDLDHGVLAVGYGVTDKNEKYYIVKNSWGLTYGDNGYILMSREKNNQCGIATAASYPTV